MDVHAPPIRVAVVNDYAIVVRGVEAIFGAHPDRFTVVAAAPLSATGADLARAQGVDVVLLDPFASGEPLQDRIPPPSLRGATRYAVLTWHSSPAAVTAALEIGCTGYLSKTLDASSLTEAVEAIDRGETVVALSTRWPAARDPVQWPGHEAGLTARESEVLCLIAQGLTNRQIGERTYIGAESLKTHIRSAYRKIGVTRRSEAIVWCFRNGLAPAPHG